MKIYNGYVVYDGPSRLNGKPIVALLTGFKGTTNVKTGNMLQLYILNKDNNPIEAAKRNDTLAICGSCPLRKRHINGKFVGACYVNLIYTNQVYKSYKKGNYPALTDYSLIKGRSVRLGAYGDPTALPIEVLDKVTEFAEGYTGYTHHWYKPENAAYKRYCMASCDNATQAVLASSDGWSTFRHKGASDNALANEKWCPADKKSITCQACQKCAGQKGFNIVIDRHGVTASHFKWSRFERTL